jgi:hypothetical protein
MKHGFSVNQRKISPSPLKYEEVTKPKHVIKEKIPTVSRERPDSKFTLAPPGEKTAVFSD